MKTYAPFDRNETWHRTDDGVVQVTWKIASTGEARVMYIETEPDRICYQPDAYPTLSEAREQMPELETVWDLIRQEHGETQSGGRAEHEHAGFFHLPY